MSSLKLVGGQDARPIYIGVEDRDFIGDSVLYAWESDITNKHVRGTYIPGQEGRAFKSLATLLDALSVFQPIMVITEPHPRALKEEAQKALTGQNHITYRGLNFAEQLALRKARKIDYELKAA